MEEKNKFIKPAKRNSSQFQRSLMNKKKQSRSIELKEMSSANLGKNKSTSRDKRIFDKYQKKTRIETNEPLKNTFQQEKGSKKGSEKLTVRTDKSDIRNIKFDEALMKPKKKTLANFENNDKIRSDRLSITGNKNLKAVENKSNVSQDSGYKNNTEYRRSDSKYSKEKTPKSRSSPRYEYNLDDADENERELILRGTINDRLNCLALLCARNPSEKNYKQLLQFCENQRNDVIYSTLKLVRDLIKEKSVENIYIKGRIIKSFEMGCKNQYIKEKTIEIVGVLMRADIYTEDFINILISRLIEKGKALTLVENALKSTFSVHEALIFEGIEDFYYKNDEFRCQYNLLKFIKNLEVSSCKERFFSFYNQALSSLDEYAKDQKDLMIELLVNGLSSTIYNDCRVDSIDLIRSYVKSPRSIISVLNLLIKTQDPYTESYVLKVSRTSILRNTKYEPEFLNMIFSIDNKDLFAKLIDNSFYYSVPSILSLMFIGIAKQIEINSMFSLRLFATHYNPVVRDIASKILNREKIIEFDPFDTVYLENLAASFNNTK